MSDQVLIALIGSLQAVSVAFIGVLAVRLGKVSRDTAATREQVVNDHTTNMRVENDERHAESLTLIGEVRNDIGGIRADIRAQNRRLTTLEELELTDPRPRKDT